MRARLPQLAAIASSEMVANLLMIERLADACAEGEFVDLGVSEQAGVHQLELLLRRVLGKRAPA
jgi:hypothetical protein